MSNDETTTPNCLTTNSDSEVQVVTNASMVAGYLSITDSNTCSVNEGLLTLSEERNWIPAQQKVCKEKMLVIPQNESFGDDGLIDTIGSSRNEIIDESSKRSLEMTDLTAEEIIPRPPAVKRETSYTDSTDRQKKRVKFSSHISSTGIPSASEADNYSAKFKVEALTAPESSLNLTPLENVQREVCLSTSSPKEENCCKGSCPKNRQDSPPVPLYCTESKSVTADNDVRSVTISTSPEIKQSPDGEDCSEVRIDLSGTDDCKNLHRREDCKDLYGRENCKDINITIDCKDLSGREKCKKNTLLNATVYAQTNRQTKCALSSGELIRSYIISDKSCALNFNPLDGISEHEENTKIPDSRRQEECAKRSEVPITTSVKNKHPAVSSHIFKRTFSQVLKSTLAESSGHILSRNSKRLKIEREKEKNSLSPKSEAKHAGNTAAQQIPTHRNGKEREAISSNKESSTARQRIENTRGSIGSTIINKIEKMLPRTRCQTPLVSAESGTPVMKKSEADRLRNEVRRLGFENKRLQDSLSELRCRLDEEALLRKQLKREYEQGSRLVREEESRRWQSSMEELTARMKEEYRGLLVTQVARLKKAHAAEVCRVSKEREEELRRLIEEATHSRLELEAFRTKDRNRNGSCDSQRMFSVDREVDKLRREILALKDQKFKLENAIENLSAKERLRSSELRLLQEEHDLQMAKLVRESKKETQSLLSELRSKARRVASLEKSLHDQVATIRQLQKVCQEKEDTIRSSSRKPVSRSASTGSSLAKKRDRPPSKERIHSTSTKPTDPTKESPKKSDQKTLSDCATEENGESKDNSTEQEEVSKLKEIISKQKEEIDNLTKNLSEDKTEEGAAAVSQNGEQQVPDNFVFSEMDDHGDPDPRLDFFDFQFSPSRHLIQPSFSSAMSYTRSFSYGQPSLESIRELSDREAKLTEENDSLRAELQETRDHVDLLEFRILEFTEGLHKESNKVLGTCDQSTSTCDVTELGGALDQTSEDLSQPLSLDSGLDFGSDLNGKTIIAEGKEALAQLSRSTGAPESSTIQKLSSLLDWASMLPTLCQLTPSSPPITNSDVRKNKMGVSEDAYSMLLACKKGDELTGGELTLLAARLQESLADPQSQESILEETIEKLRSLDSSLAGLQCRVRSLTEENKDLQEALTALGEAHETRTEASGTESELVHRKTPSLHSDLSDAESDDTSRPSKLRNFEASSSFQESGIFETACEMISAFTQTAQESDDYLDAFDCGRISLSKHEYDAILATERRLQQEVEALRCEKEHLNNHINSLEVKIKNVKDSDMTEVFRGEIRVLEQKLITAEEHKQLFFDEKCELEEAENDARLRGQRLESQLEAAREMEALLSASLSQEQEFSRELQRKVRELQMIEKERRSRQEILEAECRLCRERADELSAVNEHLSFQLMFILNGFILALFWKNHISGSSFHAVVPYHSTVIFPARDQPANETHSSVHHSTSALSSTDFLVSFASKCDASVQTQPLFQPLHLSRISSQYLGAEAMESAEECRHLKERVPTIDQSTMTVDMKNISDREEYYLSQIKLLQEEKKTLRRDYEAEKSICMQQCKELQDELQITKESLEESAQEKCDLLCRLEEVQQSAEQIKQTLHRHINELKTELQRRSEFHLTDLEDLRKQYEEKMTEVRARLVQYERRAADLMRQLTAIHEELEAFHPSVSEEAEVYYCSGSEDPARPHHPHGAEDIMRMVRELVKSERNLKQRAEELEKKESAYKQTIEEADRIMSSHMTSYMRRIEDLELCVEQKDSRIQQLESSEERLRTSLKSNTRSDDGARISELLDKLIETENSELKLKERVWNLERREKELQIKLVEEEKAKQSLRDELRDQEEMIHRLMSLTAENNALTSQIQEAHEAARRAGEILQSEAFLRVRVEEFELTEASLRETLTRTEQLLEQRDKKAREQLRGFEEEMCRLKEHAESLAIDQQQSREAETALKRCLEETKVRLQLAEKELQDSSSENMNCESQHRSEVTKLRSQLRLANSQLTDLENLNSELREHLAEAEKTVQEMACRLEERIRRHETEVLSLNLQMGQKDSRIEELEGQLQHLSRARATGELDVIVDFPLLSVQKVLASVVRDMKACPSCRTSCGNRLNELRECLCTVKAITDGRNENSYSESEDYDPKGGSQTTGNSSTTSFPEPCAGRKECTSGEELRAQASRKPRNLGGSPTVPAAPPRPRRDARKKRRLGNHFGTEDDSILAELEESEHQEEDQVWLRRLPGSCTILEELEEKVRELEDAMSRKEEELRLADLEAADLHSRIQVKENQLLVKGQELESVSQTLATLREQLLVTVQEYEKSKLDVDNKHKAELEKLANKIHDLTSEIARLTHRGKIKDSIIATLISQIRAILRSGNMSVIINQLKRIEDQQTVSEAQPSADGTSEMTDFDVDVVCSLLSQPYEVAASPQTAKEPKDKSNSLISRSPCSSSTPLQTGHVNHSISSSESSPSNSAEHSIVMTIKRLSSGDKGLRKSLIPRPKSRPVTNGTSAKAEANGSSQQDRKETHLKIKKKYRVASRYLLPRKDFQSNSQRNVVSGPKQTAKLVATTSTASSLPLSSPRGKKESRRQNMTTTYLSDARKVKRMVTGVAPLHAAVDCASAPEWKSNGGSLKVESTCVPRPKDLRITRRVGVDGVVIAWAPLEHDCVAGFQITVGGRVVQQVRSPHRTKALVTGLPTPAPSTIGLITVATNGLCSAPVIVTYDRSSVYKGLTPASAPASVCRRTAHSCL